jgi:tetratricopeptide (TPR) repeat protein
MYVKSWIWRIFIGLRRPGLPAFQLSRETELRYAGSVNLPPNWRRYALGALMALVLVYGILAGLRTVTDPDTGWQLATGRYIAQHHQIPSTDVLSYTAHDQEWIYPPLAELVLYGLYVVGGFAALSWLNSIACAATVAIAFAAESSFAAIALAILAIPSIAARTAPRADLFTTVLFAALLTLLWRYYRGRRAPLWLIPLLMLVWVNAHPGFVAGLALLGGYAVLELLDYPFPDRRSAAVARLRRAAPWLLTALPVTLCNPWGWNIYATVFRQEQAQSIHENVIAEWRQTPLSFDALMQALDWRNPESSYWWLLAAAAVAFVVTLKRKRLGPAALLLAFGYLSIRNLRFQALFAIVAIVVAAPYLSGWSWQAWLKPKPSAPEVGKTRLKHALPQPAVQPRSWPAVLFFGICIVFVAIHAHDLISERAYVAAGKPTLFGAGLSSWYPERAAEFLLRENLPANIFHEYNMGGYFAFRLGPQYPDYIDGRAIPFGDLMFEQRSVMRQSPDSPAWQEEADQRGIETLIFSLARYWGLGSTHLEQFCASKAWKPVYLDEEGAVFVRNRPENGALIGRLQIDCGKATFNPPTALTADKSFRGRAELFNFYANAGSILFKLGRNAEAAQDLDHAIQMFPEEPYLHHTRGQLYEASGQFQDAEREYLTSSRLNPTEGNWYSLGMLYSSQRRYAEAVRALQHAAAISAHPAGFYLYLAQTYLTMNQAQDALTALDSANHNSENEPPDVKKGIDLQIAERRAQAWAKLGDLRQAVGFQQEALTYDPSSSRLWTKLADYYAAQGQPTLEQYARQRAQTPDQSRPSP